MPTYTNSVRFFAIVAVFLGALAMFAPTQAKAQFTTLENAMMDISAGSDNAPVTLHEYPSLSCPHCADFHINYLPDIKKKYVDTGKVRIVFHNFPHNNDGLSAMVVVRCAAPERRYDFFDMLYQTQEVWLQADNRLASIASLARFFGLNVDDIKTCISNQELIDAIVADADNASMTYDITSVPSFVLNGNKIEGMESFSDLDAHLDNALEAVGAK